VQNQFASDGDGQVNVVVARAPQHSIVVRTFGSTDPSGVLRAVLGRKGTIAWVDDTGALRAASPGGAPGGCVFDHGPVTATSLHLANPGTAAWMDGATPHTAPLLPASCVP